MIQISRSTNIRLLPRKTKIRTRHCNAKPNASPLNNRKNYGIHNVPPSLPPSLPPFTYAMPEINSELKPKF